MDTAKSPRKLWLDGLRALAIIFVVIVHTIQSHENLMFFYNVFVGPIMIPLFFAISGYLFNDRNGKQSIFYKKLLNSIIIPGLFLSLVWVKAIFIPIKGFSYFTESLINLISGTEKWFFAACIIGEIIFFYTRKFFKSTVSTCIVSFIIFVIGIILAKFDIGNFAMFNRALIAQAFFSIGFLIKKSESKLEKIKLWQILSFAILFVIMGITSIFVWPNQFLDVHLNQYYNLPYCMAMIFLGCVTIFLLAKKIAFAPKFLVFIGQNTFIIYFLHNTIFYIFTKMLSVLGLTNINSYFEIVLKICFSIIICCLIAIPLNKFVPFLVGKKKK